MKGIKRKSQWHHFILPHEQAQSHFSGENGVGWRGVCCPKGYIRGSLKSGSAMTMGRRFHISPGCLPSSNDSNSMLSWSNPRGKIRERCPIKSKHEITSPTGNHGQVQMNSHILHIFLCFHLSCQRSIYGLHSYQYDVSKPL